MKKKLLLLLCAVMALTAGSAFGADPDTRTMKITLVIPNAKPVLEATNATQTIKKGGALQTITVTSTAGDWITWTNTLPSGWTDSADYDTKKYTLTPPASPNLTVNSTNTYTVTAKNDSGDTVQNITITVKGSNVDSALTNAKGEFTGTRGTPATTTDSSTGASTTTTKTTFTDTYSRELLTADVAITAEATDFTAASGVEFARTFSVDVTLDLKDTDYTLYSYSLDVAGLPDWLTLGGTVTADEDFATPKHHEFTLTGTPSAKADAVTLVFTATVKISGDTPVLVALGSKDVNVAVGDAVLVSLDAAISCDPLTVNEGSTGSVTAALTVKGNFSDGSTTTFTDYTAVWSTASTDVTGITFADGVLSVSSAAKAGVYNFPIKAAITRGELSATAEAVVAVTIASGSSGTGTNVPTLSVASASWDLKVGEAFTQSITAASDSNITWSYTGTLPAGLAITSQDKTLTLSGTPAAGSAGNYTLTITAANSTGSTSASVTLRVASETGEFAPTLSVTSGSWDAKVGEPFTQSISATSNSTVTWSYTGNLPAGISVNSSDAAVASSGVLRVSEARTYTLTFSGTPSASSAGTYSLTITAANSAGGASIPITLTVANADTSSNNNGGNNDPYSGGNSGSTDDTTSNPDADVVVTPTGDTYSIAEDGSLEIISTTSGNLSDILDQLTPAQKASITSIKINDKITNLSGLSGLTNLEELDLSDASSLTNADLSGNTSIKMVTIEGNRSIVSLNLSGSSVETVNAKNCGNITEVNVQGCNNLITLDVSYTNIAQLNADDCSNLEALYCENCKITSLSIENCWKLNLLDCSNNRLPFLRVVNMRSLRLLRSNNQRIDAMRPKGFTGTGRMTLNLAGIFGLSGRNSEESPLILGLITASDAETDSAPAEDYGFQFVRNVKAWDDDGEELSVEFDQSTGTVTFSGLPAKFAYDFDTGFENTLMDVSVFISEDDEDGNADNPSDDENGNTDDPADENNGNNGGDNPAPTPAPAPDSNDGDTSDNFGSSGGGCDAFGTIALASVLGLFLKKRR